MHAKLARAGRSVLIVAAGLSGALLATVGAQETFRASADLVPVYVTVTGPGGRHVPDLTREDFTLSADGRDTPIAAFSAEPQPFAVVVMLDYSGSVSPVRSTVLKAAGHFLSLLLPGDRARVGGFSYHVPSAANRVILGPQEFTGDVRVLLDTLDGQSSVMGASASPIWAATARALDSLGTQSLRRVLILLSDGYNSALTGADLGEDRSVPAARRTVLFHDVQRRVREEQVAVYSLGLTVRKRSPDGMTTTTWPPDSSMRDLAHGTGGEYYEVTSSSNFEKIFADIADDLHSQYLLGFVPNEPDGRARRLEVKVRKPDLRVRAARTYVAAPRLAPR